MASGPDKRIFFIGLAGLVLLGAVWRESYVHHVMILCFLWVMVVVGWDLVLGYVGIFNFAQLVFFAAGAYATGMLSIELGVPALPALLAGAVCVGALGLLIGLPCLRLRGEYIALFTFAVHLAVPAIIDQGRSWGTGGTTGLLGVPPMELFGAVITTRDKMAWYLLALAVASTTVWLVYFVLLPGRVGRAFIALRDSEDFARSLGVNDFRYKLLAFAISATVTGIAGGLYAQYISVVTPKILGNEFFLMAMLMVSVGGLGRFPGVILGAMLITIGNELLRDVGQYRLLLLGVCVVLVIRFLPNGVVRMRIWRTVRRVRDQIASTAPD